MNAVVPVVLCVLTFFCGEGSRTFQANLAKSKEAVELMEQLAEQPNTGAFVITESQLEPKDAAKVQELMKRLVALGQPAVPALIKALKSGDDALQGRAALVLAEIGEDAERAIPELIPLLKRDTPYLPLRMTRQALHKFGKLAMADLFQATKDADPQLRWHATEALGSIRPVPRELPGMLVPLLGDESDSVKCTAARMLVAIGEPAVEEVIAAMEKDVDNKLYGTCWIMQNIGPPAKKAIPALREKLKAPYPVVEHASHALLAIEVERCALEARSKDAQTRGVAIYILSEGYWRNGTAAEGEPAVQTLVVALRDPSADIRKNAAEGLMHTAKWAKVTLPALLIPAQDAEEDERVRRQAIIALGTLRAAGREAVPVLRQIAGKSETLQAVAVRAIERIETPEANLGCEE